MTEEEKLAEEYAAKVEPFMDVGTDNSISVYHEEDVKQAFLAGYKAKTDEINKIGLALQSDMDKTIEQNIKLKAQIEKMKCCRNCKKLDNRKVECSEGSDLIYFFGKNCDKWEIKENE